MRAGLGDELVRELRLEAELDRQLAECRARLTVLADEARVSSAPTDALTERFETFRTDIPRPARHEAPGDTHVWPRGWGPEPHER